MTFPDVHVRLRHTRYDPIDGGGMIQMGVPAVFVNGIELVTTGLVTIEATDPDVPQTVTVSLPISRVTVELEGQASP